VPLAELPDPDADNGGANNQGESLRQQEAKWNDLHLQQLADSAAAGGDANNQQTGQGQAAANGRQ